MSQASKFLSDLLHNYYCCKRTYAKSSLKQLFFSLSQDILVRNLEGIWWGSSHSVSWVVEARCHGGFRPSKARLGWAPGWLTHRTSRCCWLSAGDGEGTVDQNTHREPLQPAWWFQDAQTSYRISGFPHNQCPTGPSTTYMTPCHQRQGSHGITSAILYWMERSEAHHDTKEGNITFTFWAKTMSDYVGVIFLSYHTWLKNSQQ